MKNDHRSKFSNLTEQLEKKKPEKKKKKIRASTGFEPVTSALLVRCSTNWAMKPHIGSEVNLLSSYLPWGVKWCEVSFNDVKYTSHQCSSSLCTYYKLSYVIRAVAITWPYNSHIREKSFLKFHKIENYTIKSHNPTSYYFSWNHYPFF